MTRKYLTSEFDRGATTALAIENQKEIHIKSIRFSLERGKFHHVLWRINELRAIADLLDRKKGRAIWYNVRPRGESTRSVTGVERYGKFEDT